MRIIFLEQVLDYGGARLSTVELAERLSKDHEVLLVDFDGSCQPFVKAVNEKNLPLRILTPRDTPFVISGSESRIRNYMNLLAYIPYQRSLSQQMKKVVASFKPDYIIVNNSKTMSILEGKGKRDYEVVFFARGWFIPRNLPRLDKYLTKKLVDHYVCVSEATRHAVFVGGLVPLDKIYVVHNAMNEDKLVKEVADIPVADGVVKILHSGGFLKDKGHDVSLAVAKKLKERGFKFKLILTGLVYKGPVSRRFYEHVLHFIKENGLEDEVMIVEGKTNVIPYFRAVDIVIHPSATEGLPRVVMEAMALKKPVIANAVGGVTDYILPGYTGYTTHFNDADDYVEYIEKLSNDPAHYEFISNNAYELISASYREADQIAQMNKVFTILEKNKKR